MRATMRLVLVLVVGPAGALGAQTAPPLSSGRDPSAFSITIGYGSATSDWFRGLYESDGLNRFTAGLGGLSIAGKVLIGKASRLRIGGEIGIMTIAAGGSGDVIGQARRSAPRCSGCFGVATASGRVTPRPATGPATQIITTYYVPGRAAPDDAGIHVNALTSVRLGGTGRVIWRVEAGGGLMYWNLDEAGRAQQQNNARKSATGRAYFDSRPGMEPMLVARLVPTMVWGGRGPSGAALALDPYVSWIATTGTTATSFVNFGVGFGVQLGGRR